MGFGELVVAATEVYQLIKTIKDILDELDIDEKDVEEALKKLKEACEGPLVDAIGHVVDELMKYCSQLIKDFLDLFNIMEKDIKDIEKTDEEGAKLLREALRM